MQITPSKEHVITLTSVVEVHYNVIESKRCW